jgi:translation initiation factor 1 (eIF-1/SUI1)
LNFMLIQHNDHQISSPETCHAPVALQVIQLQGDQRKNVSEFLIKVWGGLPTLHAMKETHV